MDLEQLRTIFGLCDVGWVFDEGAEERSRQILREMVDVDRVFASEFGRPLDPPIEQAIAADVTRFKPLVQAFASPMTAPIRAMIYCVLDGAQVKAVQYEYVYRQVSRLRVSIEFDSGEKATFESDELWDAEALRHFGLMKMGEKPVIDGYYAFRKGE
jgi:hypothetical protein